MVCIYAVTCVYIFVVLDENISVYLCGFYVYIYMNIYIYICKYIYVYIYISISIFF